MFSWWNSSEVVSRLGTLSNFAIALLGIWVFVIGRRESNLIDKETSAANDARDRLISANSLETAQALREAGDANANASKLNKESEELRKSNLELEKQVVELKLKLQPRSINREDKERFIGLLRDIPGKQCIRVGYTSSATETVAYASQIQDMLRSAGFICDGNLSIFLGKTFFKAGSATVLILNSAPPTATLTAENVPPIAFAIISALNAIGIATSNQSAPDMVASGDIAIYVTDK